MKVLVIGKGGRENAICWKLKQSPLLTDLFIAPGNPGTAKLGVNVAIEPSDITALKDFALKNKIDLTVVGPEDPLVAGIVDHFQSAGLKIFGPSKVAAQLEGSKEFAKEVMLAAGVPTAEYAVFSDKDTALKYVRDKKAPLVVKADGLAAGKGVFVCMKQDELEGAIPQAFDRFHSSKVVIEEYLNGCEASFIVATDGKRIVPLAASHDYKRVFDNNRGANTGGMGTVSPTPHLSKDQEEWVMQKVMRPMIDEMARRGTPFSGFLYAGLMITDDGIKVLEFNTRLGDPETQVILRRMDGDLLALLKAFVDGEETPKISCRSEAAVCLVLAAQGYPEAVKVGDEIKGVDKFDGDDRIVVFHAGTKDQDGKLYTAGGRVLCITANGEDVKGAREVVYQGVKEITFEGMHYRRDIGGN